MSAAESVVRVEALVGGHEGQQRAGRRGGARAAAQGTKCNRVMGAEPDRRRNVPRSGRPPGIIGDRNCNGFLSLLAARARSVLGCGVV